MNKHPLVKFREALALRLADIQAIPARSRELSLAVTCAQSGRMLLGSALAELNVEPNPYPHADDPKSAVISPTAHLSLEPYASNLPEDVTAAVKTVRSRLEGDIRQVIAYRRERWPKSYGSVEELFYDHALVMLALSKQYLGEQLAVIAGHNIVKTGDGGRFLNEIPTGFYPLAPAPAPAETTGAPDGVNLGSTEGSSPPPVPQLPTAEELRIHRVDLARLGCLAKHGDEDPQRDAPGDRRQSRNLR